MVTRIHLGLLHEDHLYVSDTALLCLAGKSTARDLGAHGFSIASRVGPVDQLVLAIPRMGNDIEQTALTARRDLGQADHRLCEQLTLANHAKIAGLFGDERQAVGQQRHTPGHRQVAGNRLHFERVTLSFERRLLRHRHRRGDGNEHRQKKFV